MGLPPFASAGIALSSRCSHTNIGREEVLSEVITTAEAARLLGYTPQHVRRLVRDGRLEGTKIGRDWVILRDSISAYLAARDNLNLDLEEEG